MYLSILYSVIAGTADADVVGIFSRCVCMEIYFVISLVSLCFYLRCMFVILIK